MSIMRSEKSSQMDDLLAVAYGYLGMELRVSGDIDEAWVPVNKRHRPMFEKDVMAVFDTFRGLVRNMTKEELNRRAERANEAVEKLHDKDSVVNQFLLALSFAIHVVEKELPKPYHISTLPKLMRAIRHAEKEIGDRDIINVTRRRSHDIYRIVGGGLAIPDFVRDANLEKLKRRRK